jgi:nucleoside-diphosphate-sugar epimerase
MAEHSHTTLMTGATGFLGSFILRDLLRRDRRVVAMLRPPLDASKRRLTDLLAKLDVDVAHETTRGRLLLVSGALPGPLPEPDWGTTDDILACAASLQLFSNGNCEPHQTNVDGTVAMLDWARRHGVTRYHAVSTAYVCGSYTDSVREVFHTPRPEFKTEYETSKWLAELLLDQWGQESGNVLTVFRPSFLVGDSTSGYTTQFGGFYQLSRLVSLLKTQFGNGDRDAHTHIPLRIPGRPEDPQNFVPVDFASRIITEVVLAPELNGRIYHLTDPEPLTNDDVKRHLEAYFRMHGGYFVDPAHADEEAKKPSLAESLLWEKYDVVTPRVSHNPRFDQANTREVMQATGVGFPSIDQDRFFTLLDYAVAQNWGQRSNGKHT